MAYQENMNTHSAGLMSRHCNELTASVVAMATASVVAMA